MVAYRRFECISWIFVDNSCWDQYYWTPFLTSFEMQWHVKNNSNFVPTSSQSYFYSFFKCLRHCKAYGPHVQLFLLGTAALKLKLVCLWMGKLRSLKSNLHYGNIKSLYTNMYFSYLPSVPAIKVDKIFWDFLSFVIFSDINFQNLKKRKNKTQTTKQFAWHQQTSLTQQL